MVRINMNAPTGRELTPGVDLWEIVKCEAKQARSGAQMLKIEFSRVSRPADRVFDNVMLEGPGWPLGQQKLVALGVPMDFNDDLDPLQLLNKRVWLSTGIETYEGKNSLKVLINELKHAGMQAVDDVPPGCSLPSGAPF